MAKYFLSRVMAYLFVFVVGWLDYSCNAALLDIEIYVHYNSDALH